MNGNSSGFLEKFSWGAVIAGIATFFALFFGFPEYIFNLRPQMEKAIGTSTISFIEGAITASVVAIIVLKLLGSRGKESQHQERKKRSEEKALDPRFTHLTIHYSQRTDTPEVMYPARPRLVVYYEKKKGYWVPTWLEPYIKQHKLNWHTHDGEKALRTWLKKEKIEPHETDPSPEDLDLENLLEIDRLSVESKESVGKLPKSITDMSIVKTPSLFDRNKLIEVYSPIHAMIVRINKKIPRETALQGGLIGQWVEASLIDFDSIREVFNQHNDKLRKRDFDMWLEIDDELKERKEKTARGNGFFLDKRRQEWFDELEAEYNRLKDTSWG